MKGMQQHPARATLVVFAPKLAALAVLAVLGCAAAGPAPEPGSAPAPRAPTGEEAKLEEARVAVEAQDFGRAVELLRPLAQAGDAQAQVGLGHLYSTGSGVPRDEAEAARWYRLAADQGHPIAQYNLAIAYLKGLGVEADPVEAMMWVSLSASEGLPQARDLYDELAEVLDRAQREEGKRRAREWQERAPGAVSPTP